MSVEVVGVKATRFDYFSVSPSRPVVGEQVKITGKMAFHEIPMVCWWKPFGGREVWLLIDKGEIDSVLTDSNGEFTFYHVFDSPGTYRVEAEYRGDPIHNPSKSQTVWVEVISKEQKEEEERRFWMMVGLGGAAAVAVIGGVLYYIEMSRRREMMMAALARG